VEVALVRPVKEEMLAIATGAAASDAHDHPLMWHGVDVDHRPVGNPKRKV
jgi:hypothetical protein